MDSILLTGASGYLGSSVLAEGRHRGLNIVPLSGRLEEIRPRSLEASVVIHCAGALRNRLSECDETNRLGMQFLLEGFQQPVPIVFVSSRGVYAANQSPMIDEGAPLGPEDPYGISKLEAERLLLERPNPSVIFRATALYGFANGVQGSAFPARALEEFLESRTVFLHDPDRECDYLYVRSLAHLLLRAAAPGPHWGQVYNVAGPPRGLHGMIRLLGDLVRKRTSLPPRISRRAGPPPRAPLLSTRKLEDCFGPLDLPEDEAVFDQMIEEATRS